MAIRPSHRVLTPGSQPVVRVLEARPHGVASDFGRLEHVEDGSHGGRSKKGDIGVPPAGPIDLAVDGQDLAALGDGREYRMGFGHLTELPGEVRLLLGRQ